MEVSAITELVGSMGLRAAAASAADLVGPRPVTEMAPATALGLLAGEGAVGMVAGVAQEESSGSTKEGTRARPNEEGTDGEVDGCGSTVCMLSGALPAFPLLVVHGFLVLKVR